MSNTDHCNVKLKIIWTDKNNKAQQAYKKILSERELFIIYLPKGGSVQVNHIPENGTYKWFDPKRGEFVSEGKINYENKRFTSPVDDSTVLLVQKED